MQHATRLGSHQQQHHQQKHQKIKVAGYCYGPVLRSVLLWVVLGSAIGGPSASTGSHRSWFAFRGGHSSSRGVSTQATPQRLSLADRFRGVGSCTRRDNAGGRLLGEGGGKGRGKTMVAAAAAAEAARKKTRDTAVKPAQSGPPCGAPKSNGNGGRNSFVAGGLAGSISTTITCPIEVGVYCVMVYELCIVSASPCIRYAFQYRYNLVVQDYCMIDYR